MAAVQYLIKSGGENTYPAEIERTLIGDAAVVRRPAPRWGEVPFAFVLPRSPDLIAQHVLEACRGRIAS